MMPSASLQERRSCRAVAERPHSRIQSMARHSNSAVKRLPASAQGTRTCLTPCSGHAQRGTSASRMVWNWHVSRCRQRRGWESYPGQAVPHSGHSRDTPWRLPRRTITDLPSRSRSTSTTSHGSGRLRILAYRSRSRIMVLLTAHQGVRIRPRAEFTHRVSGRAEKGRIGETTHCLCFTCLHTFDLDLHRDIKRCPPCASQDVKSGRGAVGCTCPKCGKGAIHEEFSAFVNCLPFEEATTIEEARERAARMAKPREPEKCIYCGGTGECYCKRRQWDDPHQCVRCKGTGRCHVCCGTGLMCRGTVA